MAIEEDQRLDLVRDEAHGSRFADACRLERIQEGSHVAVSFSRISQGELEKAERRGREQRAKHRTCLSRESRRFLGGRSRVVDLAEMSEKESPHPRKHALLGGLARLSRDLIALLGFVRCGLPIALEPGGCREIALDQRK